MLAAGRPLPTEQSQTGGPDSKVSKDSNVTPAPAPGPHDSKVSKDSNVTPAPAPGPHDGKVSNDSSVPAKPTPPAPPTRRLTITYSSSSRCPKFVQFARSDSWQKHLKLCEFRGTRFSQKLGV